MSELDFGAQLVDLLVIGPACPMPPGRSQPYAVHRKGKTETVWVHPDMTREMQAEFIAYILETYGPPCAEVLRERHPSKMRAEQLIRAAAAAPPAL